jgi:hypothetical protein
VNAGVGGGGGHAEDDSGGAAGEGQRPGQVSAIASPIQVLPP